MIRVTKTDANLEIEAPGRTITLVSRSWIVTANTPWFGLGANYRRPYLLNDGASRRIYDHVMLARMAGLALLILAVLSRRVGR